MNEQAKLIVRLLSAVASQEGNAVFDMSVLSEKALKTTTGKRDAMAIRLQKEGYMDGVRMIESIDGQQLPTILWEHSFPMLTMKGIEYMNTDGLFVSAAKEIASELIGAGVQMVTNEIVKHFG